MKDILLLAGLGGAEKRRISSLGFPEDVFRADIQASCVGLLCNCSCSAVSANQPGTCKDVSWYFYLKEEDWGRVVEKLLFGWLCSLL